MITSPHPLWNELTQDEQDEFLAIHLGEHPDGEIRLNQLQDLAHTRQKEREEREG